MKNFIVGSLEHLMILFILAYLVGFLAAGCGGEPTDDYPPPTLRMLYSTPPPGYCRHLAPNLVDIAEPLQVWIDGTRRPILHNLVWKDDKARGFYVIPTDNDNCLYGAEIP